VNLGVSSEFQQLEMQSLSLTLFRLTVDPSLLQIYVTTFRVMPLVVSAVSVIASNMADLIVLTASRDVERKVPRYSASN
jgi:hypothetical protein